MFRLPVLISVFHYTSQVNDFGVDLVFTLLLDIWWFLFGFGSCAWKIKKQYYQSGFMNFQKNMISGNF